MKKHSLLARGSIFLPLALLSLTGCASNVDLVLRVYNCEDYIADSIIPSFEEYAKEELGKTVKVVYDTYDTNETMLSSLKTGKTTYDLICASDYTLQKMVHSDMCQPINMEHVPNYTKNGAAFILDKMESITTTIVDSQGNETTVSMGDYSVGYMWGTLGILYNPEKIAKDKNYYVQDEEGNYVLDEEKIEQIKIDTDSWDVLWDPAYHGEASIKDSMRDTYSIGIMRQFEEEILTLMKESGCFDENDNLLEGKFEEALASYNPKLTEIFNRCDQDTVKLIEGRLLELKDNVFGFEVDSGKDDMVKGLIGMNTAWSGDAVYAMDRGDNESGQTIYYSVPSVGGNIWFDGWVMTKGISEEQVALSELFLNYLCDSEVASLNMDETGYTSFIAGDIVLSLVRDWYDPRSYAMYVYHEDEEDWEESDFLYDESTEERLFQTGFGLEDDLAEFDPEFGILDMTGSTYEAPVIDGEPHTWEEYIEIYNAKAEQVNALIASYNETSNEAIDEIELLEEWDVRDLTYMFEGTLEELALETYGDTPETNPFLFYSDEIETIVDELGVEHIAGRQFLAQYPDQTMIPKLAIMSDYGNNNQYVLDMWQNVKAVNLPLEGVVVFAIMLVGLAMGLAFFFVTKAQYRKIKVARRKAQARKD